MCTPYEIQFIYFKNVMKNGETETEPDGMVKQEFPFNRSYFCIHMVLSNVLVIGIAYQFVFVGAEHK